MKELPISSMDYLIKGTMLNAELFNKSAVLQWLITKLLKGRKPAVFYSVLNVQLVPRAANTVLASIIHFIADWRKCFNVFKKHSLRAIPYWPVIRLQNIHTAISLLSVLSISGLQVQHKRGLYNYAYFTDEVKDAWGEVMQPVISDRLIAAWVVSLCPTNLRQPLWPVSQQFWHNFPHFSFFLVFFFQVQSKDTVSDTLTFNDSHRQQQFPSVK